MRAVTQGSADCQRPLNPLLAAATATAPGLASATAPRRGTDSALPGAAPEPGPAPRTGPGAPCGRTREGERRPQCPGEPGQSPGEPAEPGGAGTAREGAEAARRDRGAPPCPARGPAGGPFPRSAPRGAPVTYRLFCDGDEASIPLHPPRPPGGARAPQVCKPPFPPSLLGVPARTN